MQDLNILTTQIFSNIGSQSLSVDVDMLQAYPNHYIYVRSVNEKRPTLVRVSDLQSMSGYTVYAIDQNNKTVEIGPDRCFSPWPDRMIRSYIKRNPEQFRWYNAKTVNNLKERDALLKDSQFEPETYVWVRNGKFGEPNEYILTKNKKHWVDLEIKDASGPSGVRAFQTLYDRLSSGYLFDTFGPSGQNRMECDFVYVTYINTNLTARTWTKTGDQIRWDFGDEVLTSMGVPAKTYNPGNEIATFSTEDSFSNVSYYYFRNYFRGGFPSLDFTNVTKGSSSFRSAFSGPVPKSYDVS